jgi:hypothetical protein
MVLSKKTKKILTIVVVIVGAIIGWKYFGRDKMGGYMSVASDGTPIYRGARQDGFYIKPGTLRLVGGYWQGVGRDDGQWSYQKSGWVKL